MTIYSLDGVAPVFPESGDYWVAPDANVIGQVVFAEGTSVWFGSTLRGDNEPIVIRAGSNLQENCVCHTDPGFPLTIGENCTIGHKAMLHGCIIGDGTLVGMGATLLNGSKIGKGCIIGAGALVPEGREIPDYTLVVGVPCKAIREVDEEARAFNLQAAEKYRQRMRHYKSALEPWIAPR